MTQTTTPGHTFGNPGGPDGGGYQAANTSWSSPVCFNSAYMDPLYNTNHPAPPPASLKDLPVAANPDDTTSCKVKAEFSAVDNSQAQGDGALYSEHGRYSIRGGTMGTVAVKHGFLNLSVSQMRQYGNQITITPDDGGLIADFGGPSGGSFTISDYGDKNIDNAAGTRFDLYRFDSHADALKFGKRAFNTTIKFPNKSGAKCPS